jgi:hypothetical protein
MLALAGSDGLQYTPVPSFKNTRIFTPHSAYHFRLGLISGLFSHDAMATSAGPYSATKAKGEQTSGQQALSCTRLENARRPR